VVGLSNDDVNDVEEVDEVDGAAPRSWSSSVVGLVDEEELALLEPELEPPPWR
jgi:hypothetical protein